MSKNYIGIDNGVTGSIGIIWKISGSEFYQMPVFKQKSYTKADQNISRIDTAELMEILRTLDPSDSIVILERPFVNSKGFKATQSAMRALEATLIVIEYLKLPYQYIDSKQWQKELLPSGIKGTAELKNASFDIGCRLFPQLKEEIKKQKDADGLLIAEWARRNNL